MTKVLSHPDYPAFVAALKERILHARTLAARAVNRELILLYWDIGRGIVEKQLYLVHTSPEFLSQAMREMKAAKSSPESLSQAVRDLVTSIPWGHHANHLAKLTDPAAGQLQRPSAHRQATGRCATPRSPVREIIMARPTASFKPYSRRQEYGLPATSGTILLSQCALSRQMVPRDLVEDRFADARKTIDRNFNYRLEKLSL